MHSSTSSKLHPEQYNWEPNKIDVLFMQHADCVGNNEIYPHPNSPIISIIYSCCSENKFGSYSFIATSVCKNQPVVFFFVGFHHRQRVHFREISTHLLAYGQQSHCKQLFDGIRNMHIWWI